METIFSGIASEKRLQAVRWFAYAQPVIFLGAFAFACFVQAKHELASDGLVQGAGVLLLVACVSIVWSTVRLASVTGRGKLVWLVAACLFGPLAPPFLAALIKSEKTTWRVFAYIQFLLFFLSLLVTQIMKKYYLIRYVDDFLPVNTAADLFLLQGMAVWFCSYLAIVRLTTLYARRKGSWLLGCFFLGPLVPPVLAFDTRNDDCA